MGMTQQDLFDIRSKIGKRSSAKGGEYERRVAKLISEYHKIDWKKAFLRTKRTTGGQPHGDLKPIDEMALIWKGMRLGPIECKNRKEWSFDSVFKRPRSCKLMEYWLKSNEDTGTTDSVLFFTKPGVSDYVMLLDDERIGGQTVIKFQTNFKDALPDNFIICTLGDFLKSLWPRE